MIAKLETQHAQEADEHDKCAKDMADNAQSLEASGNLLTELAAKRDQFAAAEVDHREQKEAAAKRIATRENKLAESQAIRLESKKTNSETIADAKTCISGMQSA